MGEGVLMRFQDKTATSQKQYITVYNQHLMIFSLPWTPLQETLTSAGNKINQFPRNPFIVLVVIRPQIVKVKLLR